MSKYLYSFPLSVNVFINLLKGLRPRSETIDQTIGYVRVKYIMRKRNMIYK